MNGILDPTHPSHSFLDSSPDKENVKSTVELLKKELSISSLKKLTSDTESDEEYSEPAEV